ncbi:MAG: CHASE2 domain-containing serine/threonine-protein kinase [Desulfococcaceae bacterium]
MDILKKYPAILLGILITLLFLGAFFARPGFLETLEYRFYDTWMGLRGASERAGAEERIVLIDIDDESIEELGQWPWSRGTAAAMVRKLSALSPRLIGLNIIYSEPEESAGLEQIRNLMEMLRRQGASGEMVQTMERALSDMDNDAKLAAALEAAGNVVLPVFLRESRTVEAGGRVEDPILRSHAVTNIGGDSAGLPGADRIRTPIPPLFEATSGIGHVNVAPDVDGKVRREMLLYSYRDIYIPSFALQLAAEYLNIPEGQIDATLGLALQLGGAVELPLTDGAEMLVTFRSGENAFRRFSFVDVFRDKIPPDNLQRAVQDAIVIITPAAPGIITPLATPTDNRTNPGEFTAHTLWTILNQEFIRQPAWDRTAGLLLILFIGALIALVLPRIKAVFAGLLFLAAGSALVGLSWYLFTAGGLWLGVLYPLLQLVLGYMGVVTINFFVTESGKEKVEGESAETNRMLGLSFQSQGMLDMAFDKLRKVPVDDEMKDILFTLGQDYERKRQFNKAAAVYEYIEKHDPEYKRVGERRKRLLQASESMVWGDGFLGGGSSGGDDLMASGGDTRPTLGRYEIIKQLGKGAMGVVYLGQDPRINRTTAIKTFKFSDDFEPDEAEKMKQKFFREAESAGNLNHPNIVGIYDAGDEHDLAYIAMEFLDGEDFQKYTKKKNLLPVRKVIDFVADIADGLDYAHAKGIVHRDVKPANIMLLSSGIVKITDFGIARITASSQTQTGVVKGTPHYMSPEQISGKKVDGRSDIFSLGTMLYQLVTGDLPFRGDSPAALMHQIMNVRHPDPRKTNPKLVKPLVAIIDKALEKDREKRYQRASHLAKHLRTLGERIDAIVAQKKQAGNAPQKRGEKSAGA